MNQADAPLRIKSIKVTRLFGLYDHEVTLNADRVTVMHGPNGVGKTVFLKLIDAVINDHYHEISKVPFESFEIRFTDNSAVHIQHEKGLSSIQIMQCPPELRYRITAHLIEAQRLIRLPDLSQGLQNRPDSDHRATDTVQEYSLDLKHKLESALANYAKRSQLLDQTFPQRLLQRPLVPLTIDELKRKMQQVEQTRSRLKKIGILDSDDSSRDANPLQSAQLDALQPEQVAVMSVYANDTEEKLAVLEELAGRAEILLNVLKRKFINKKVMMSREEGLAIFGKDGESIPITALSSGEQHELVLLYDLLFKVKPNTLVLIDEPELSLHISWQKNFMDDLLEIIKLAQFDVLMATHSPYIVGDHSDLLVELSSEPVI